MVKHDLHRNFVQQYAACYIDVAILIFILAGNLSNDFSNLLRLRIEESC